MLSRKKPASWLAPGDVVRVITTSFNADAARYNRENGIEVGMTGIVLRMNTLIDTQCLVRFDPLGDEVQMLGEELEKVGHVED